MRPLKIFALLVALNTGAWITPQEASAQVSVSFQLFYDELSPYGMWVDYPNYGYVWIPNGGPRFSPYATAGHWIYTYYGWTWVSDYPWGWAAFHYGRWDYDDYYGWLWVPGDEWGPAWVSWRRSPGYYGWAPLRPGISISIAFGSGYQERNERWIFVRDRDLGRTNINNYYIDQTNNVTIIKNSTVIQNTQVDNARHETYIAGPDRNEVEKISGRTVKPVAILENTKPGMKVSNGQLQIYRPRVQKRSGNGQNPAPSKVMRLNDVKPALERNAGNRQQQPRTVSPPKKGKPSQPRDVSPPDSKGKQQQPRTVNPPNKGQPSQPRDVSPPDSKGREQQPRTVNPPNKGQPPQPRDVSPSDSKGREQQPRTVNPPNKGQPSQPQDVSPSDSKGKEKQSQDVTSPSKKVEAQPKTNEDGKDKKKQEDKKKRGR